MALYTGVLEKISGGRLLDNRMTVREFVDIGGRRIKNVILTSYQDELLQEANGEEVALSTYGRGKRANRVLAMRTPRGGVSRVRFGAIVVAFIRDLVMLSIGAVIFGVILAFLLGTVGALFGSVGMVVGLGAAVAIALCFLLAPFVSAAKTYRAWAAI